MADAPSEGFAADLIARCAEQLADFKIPREVHVLDALPEEMLGKIATGRRRQLAAGLAADDAR